MTCLFPSAQSCVEFKLKSEPHLRPSSFHTQKSPSSRVYRPVSLPPGAGGFSVFFSFLLLLSFSLLRPAVKTQRERTLFKLIAAGCSSPSLLLVLSFLSFLCQSLDYQKPSCSVRFLLSRSGFLLFLMLITFSCLVFPRAIGQGSMVPATLVRQPFILSSLLLLLTLPAANAECTTDP